MDTTRTDHHPNNPSHPTPRARDLGERLDSATDERLSRRWLDDGAFQRFVDDVKTRTDLVGLIGRDLDLQPSGSVLKARSPRNHDSAPSCVVFPATTWHDFSGGGSGGGDCLDYLVEHRGLGFMEALRELAGHAGMPMSGWSPEQAEAEAKRVVEGRRIEALFTEAAGYYHRVLPTKIRRELYGRHTCPRPNRSSRSLVCPRRARSRQGIAAVAARGEGG